MELGDIAWEASSRACIRRSSTADDAHSAEKEDILHASAHPSGASRTCLVRYADNEDIKKKHATSDSGDKLSETMLRFILEAHAGGSSMKAATSSTRTRSTCGTLTTRGSNSEKF